jgi:DsbC/DsbD-like thiol-disulfide interchange protein
MILLQKSPYRPFMMAVSAFIIGYASFAFSAKAADGSDWQKLTQSRIRLISAGGLAQGKYKAALEIELMGDALTYWRSPGDVGIAPDVISHHSDNLASLSLLFPLPHHYEEAGTDAYGYKQHVILPLLLNPTDAQKPVNADLIVHYAICDKLCVPVEAHLNLSFTPPARQSEFAPSIDAALSAVPVMTSTGFQLTSLPPLDNNKKRWLLSSESKESVDDVFAETIDGWFFSTQLSPEGALVQLEQSPSSPITNATPLILTIKTKSGAYEWHTQIK